jgi:hypothetical protein
MTLNHRFGNPRMLQGQAVPKHTIKHIIAVMHPQLQQRSLHQVGWPGDRRPAVVASMLFIQGFPVAALSCRADNHTLCNAVPTFRCTYTLCLPRRHAVLSGQHCAFCKASHNNRYSTYYEALQQALHVHIWLVFWSTRLRCKPRQGSRHILLRRHHPTLDCARSCQQ